jgi:hypothetical protein
LACFGEVAEGGIIHLLEKILISKDSYDRFRAG